MTGSQPHGGNVTGPIVAEFREAMSRLAAGVNVVTTDGPAGRAGFTATAVCSLSMDPPSLLVCMNRASEQNGVFRTNRSLCVNILSENHQERAAEFAGKTALKGQERFSTASWDRLVTGAPALRGALCCIDAEVCDIIEFGSHDIFICQARSVRIDHEDEVGVVYFQRGVHLISGTSGY